MDNFVHLHVHTEYSKLDGLARINDLVDEVVRLEQGAVAITDHGSLSGAYTFYQRCTEVGIKPIIGIEAYVAPFDRTVKEPVYWGTEDQRADDVSGGGAFTHMTLWAQNAEGLRNLFKLHYDASQVGFYYKPRIDRQSLERYGSGLMGTTGCPGGGVQTKIRLQEPDGPVCEAAVWREILGQDNYFVELMDHDLEIERTVLDDLLLLRSRLGLDVVGTNDSHYVRASDGRAHEALLCLQTGAKLTEPTYDEGGKRFAFRGSGYHLKSRAEMEMTGLPVEALNTTLAIAERVGSYDEVFQQRSLAPVVDDAEAKLRAAVWRGMNRRLRGYDVRYVERVDYELASIGEMGFSSYFLVVADIVASAISQGIRVGPGRGSAAGSLVAYALGITQLDPIQHGLIFERFLNPGRVSPPDIDLDFQDDRRSEVLEYVAQKYGSQFVAQICTHNHIGALQALRDSARVSGYEYAVGDKLAKAFPEPVVGVSAPLSAITDESHPRYREGDKLRKILAEDEKYQKTFDLACGLEGVLRQYGVHAAGVVISNTPLVQVLPIAHQADAPVPVTQWDMRACEELGLLKMDFLGLTELRVISDAMADGAVLPDTLDDAKALRLLARGETTGIFQLGGGAMKNLLKRIRVDNFNDIVAAVALYRPGPMGANSHNEYADRKNKKKSVEYAHPAHGEVLASVLAPTYGLVVYQEQLIEVVKEWAGYSLSEADLLRRVVGKKKQQEMKTEAAKFKRLSKQKGRDPDATQKLWDILAPFADYAFPKAHAASYALVAYQSAYLKAHHPKEFMAALLSSVADDRTKLAEYLAEARRMGLKVLPPDINESGLGFTPTKKGIRFGLMGIKGVGAKAAAQIMACRPWEPGRDVLELTVNAGVLRALYKSGALPDPVKVTREEKQQQELESLGFYVTSHPLDQLQQQMNGKCTPIVTALESCGQVTIGGIIMSVTVKKSRAGNDWARVVVEDWTGSVEVPLFGGAYTKAKDHLVKGSAVLVYCYTEDKDGDQSLVGRSVTPLEGGNDAA